MPTSANGYSANDRSVIASYTVPGTTLRIALRKGDVSVVLLEYLRRYHREVESLYHKPQDLWGYAERTIRGSSTRLSNHASGTAADARAVRHPLGAVGTFRASELHALNRLLAFFEGVLRHGKDYSGRKDEMHVEINRGSAEVARIARKIRSGASPTIPVIPDPGVLMTDWNYLVPDYYKASSTEKQRPPMRAAECLAWGTTHAANARDAARAAAAKATAVEAKLDTLIKAQAAAGGAPTGPVALTDADVTRIANAVLDLLSRRAAS